MSILFRTRARNFEYLLSIHAASKQIRVDYKIVLLTSID